ncbi:MAG: hypothetical protein AAGB32_03670 [Pseudomonadota bacterium]
MGNIFWPGRLQKLENTQWNTTLKQGQELWIDGGHNESAGKALSEQVRLWQKQDDKPLTIILAMVDRKDPIEFIKPLLPYADKIICTEIPDEPQSYAYKDLFHKVESLDKIKISYASSLENALTHTDKNSRVLATGSLFLIGNILQK